MIIIISSVPNADERSVLQYLAALRNGRPLQYLVIKSLKQKSNKVNIAV